MTVAQQAIDVAHNDLDLLQGAKTVSVSARFSRDHRECSSHQSWCSTRKPVANMTRRPFKVKRRFNFLSAKVNRNSNSAPDESSSFIRRRGHAIRIKWLPNSVRICRRPAEPDAVFLLQERALIVLYKNLVKFAAVECAFHE